MLINVLNLKINNLNIYKMPNSTYTAQGIFNTSRQASVNICIPAEPRPGNYATEIYNLSKNTPNGVINVIFCHFSDGSKNEMQHNSFDFRLNFDLNNINSYPGAAAFDVTKSDALFIFFHNNRFNSDDRDNYFSEIENIYDDVKNHGNQSQAGIPNQTDATDRTPRRVGMSLVVKTT